MKTSCKQCLPEVMLSGLVTCGQCQSRKWEWLKQRQCKNNHTARGMMEAPHKQQNSPVCTGVNEILHTQSCHQGLCHWSSSHNCLIILIQHQLYQHQRVCVLRTHRHTVNLNIRLNGACLWLKQGVLHTFIQRWRFQGFQGRVRGRGYTLLFLQSVTRNTLALIQVGSKGNRQRSRNICTWRQRQPLGEKNQETQG